MRKLQHLKLWQFRKNFKKYFFLPGEEWEILYKKYFLFLQHLKRWQFRKNFKKYFSSGRSVKYYKKYFLSLLFIFIFYIFFLPEGDGKFIFKKLKIVKKYFCLWMRKQQHLKLSGKILNNIFLFRKVPEKF